MSVGDAEEHGVGSGEGHTLSVDKGENCYEKKKKKVKKEGKRKRKVDLGRKSKGKGKAETPLSLQKALFWPPPLR